MVRPDLLALRLFPRTIGLKGLSLFVRKKTRVVPEALVTGFEVAIGSAAAISKVAISNGHCTNLDYTHSQ